MKVLVVTNMYPTEARPFYGIFVKEQVESVRKEGISIDVEFINGRENRLNYFISVINLIKRLKRANYDIIHAHHTYCIYPIIIAKIITQIKTPVILTFHEGEVHKTNNLKIGNVDFIKRLVFSKGIKVFALRMVDLVIAVQEELIRELNFNGEYIVLPCGVDLDLFRPIDKTYCRKKLNLPLSRKIVFFPASPTNTNKGIDILKEGIKYLGRDDIYLLTAGSIRHEEMPYYLCASDAVVQLSDYEASPMVVKEALATNVPTLFTEVGDVKSTIGNTLGCFLCERIPEDVALKLKSVLNCNGRSEGRARIIECGMGLSDVGKRIFNIYSGFLNKG